MINKFLLILSIIMFSNTDVLSQNRININIPTVEEESDYVWRTIQRINFFEEHNYQLSLPQGELIKLLINKSKANELSEEDFTSLKEFMKLKIYKKTDYQKGYEKIEENRYLINKMINKISRCKRNWNFKEFDTYQINLTLYGPGGSYNSNNGSILIFTTIDGKFKQTENPSNTIIHEITHIGIQESIINKFNVPHSLKERIVDKFVLLNFKKYLPEYRIQNMGDVRIDKYLKKKKDLRKLGEIVEKFMNKNQ